MGIEPVSVYALCTAQIRVIGLNTILLRVSLFLYEILFFPENRIFSELYNTKCNTEIDRRTPDQDARLLIISTRHPCQE